MIELRDLLADLQDRIERGIGVLNLPQKKERVMELDALAAVPDFWQDRASASKVMQERDQLQNVIDRWTELEKQIKDLRELFDLLAAGDASLRKEIEQKATSLAQELEQAENLLFLAGPYDG